MANRFLVAGGNGNWDSTSNWAATDGGASGQTAPVAGDVVAFTSLSVNASMTVNVASACASLIMSGTYAGTLTFDSTLTLTSTCTFLSACTIAGTAGALICNGTATLTSGGKTLTCALTFGAGTTTFTLADDWVVNGLVSNAAQSGINVTLNGVGRKITCNGGLRVATASAAQAFVGTAKLVIAGGTWDSTSAAYTQNDIDIQGTVTVSGSVYWGGGTTKTLAYVSGTVTTTGSTLNLTGGTYTLNLAGVTWNSITFTAGGTVTLGSNLMPSGTLDFSSVSAFPTFSGAGTISSTGGVTFSGSPTSITLNNTGGIVTTGTLTLPNHAMTFAGSAGFTVGTLTNTTYTASRTVTLTFGNTYTVTTALANVGTTAAILQSIISGTPGSKVVFNLLEDATCDLIYCNPTDIDSSGGREIITTRGVITTSTNWATAPTGGGSMAITRSAGALLGTSEATGVSLAAGAAADGDEIDLLEDDESRGILWIYVCFTPTTTGAGGPLIVSLYDTRISGQPYISLTPPWQVLVDSQTLGVSEKVALGRASCGRYGKVCVDNRSAVAMTNVSVLYCLEKEG